MAKLSILGAQRVKALQEILDKKQAEAIAALDIPSHDEIQTLVDKEYGVYEWQREIDELVAKAQKIMDKLNTATGKDYFVNKGYRSYSNNNSYNKRIRELTIEQRDAKINEVKAEYKHKSNMLWLCETLEEAKQIVGI